MRKEKIFNQNLSWWQKLKNNRVADNFRQRQELISRAKESGLIALRKSENMNS